MKDDAERAREVARQMLDHLDECNRIGKFSAIDEVHIRQIAEALIAQQPEGCEHRFGSPPEPVANPNEAWIERYSDWYYQGKG